jgi:hypothetical protein
MMAAPSRASRVLARAANLALAASSALRENARVTGAER